MNLNINITYNHGLKWYVANIDDGEHDYSIGAPTKTELINKIKNQL